jgi:hypothetical protein
MPAQLEGHARHGRRFRLLGRNRGIGIVLTAVEPPILDMVNQPVLRF